MILLTRNVSLATLLACSEADTEELLLTLVFAGRCDPSLSLRRLEIAIPLLGI